MTSSRGDDDYNDGENSGVNHALRDDGSSRSNQRFARAYACKYDIDSTAILVGVWSGFIAEIGRCVGGPLPVSWQLFALTAVDYQTLRVYRANNTATASVARTTVQRCVAGQQRVVGHRHRYIRHPFLVQLLALLILLLLLHQSISISRFKHT